MLKVEKLSYGFPSKDLYNEISFTLEKGQHCGFIGSNGAGKSTLVDMIIYPDKYFYDGKILKENSCRIGYANQFSIKDKTTDITVFDYLSEIFIDNQKETIALCDQMAISNNLEPLYEKYQVLLDSFEAMDGNNYVSNIHKKLYLSRMSDLEETKLSQLSGGEYKLIKIMREMLLSQDLLVLDEPDVFLDFDNLNRLSQLINSYKGTLLVITHNRYLLNHCFNKILHLENGDIQEFEGNYSMYRTTQLREKLNLKIQSIEEQEEIERTEKMVDILRNRATLVANPVIGSAVNAKRKQLDRLRKRQIKAPFIDIKEPKIEFKTIESKEEKTILSITNHNISFDENLLENINFDILASEKVAIVGANGTGKTTLLRDILKNIHPSIHLKENTNFACLTQFKDEDIDGSKTVYEIMEEFGFDSRANILKYLANYNFDDDSLSKKFDKLSGGEKNLLQIAIIANKNTELLILDEPTSHLDLYAQIALEKAISEYKGSILMVSHDFYLVANCANFILFVENNSIKPMRARTFRKMVYEKYFEQKYLEIDKKKQELESNITLAFKNNDLISVEKLCNQLEALSSK